MFPSHDQVGAAVDGVKRLDENSVALQRSLNMSTTEAIDLQKSFIDTANSISGLTAEHLSKSLIDDLKLYMGQAEKTNPGILKVLTGFKSALETDLRLLTKKSYQENLLKNVYPLTKGKRQKLNPNLLSDIANKLKFADKVYANGLENSIITKTLRDKAKRS